MLLYLNKIRRPSRLPRQGLHHRSGALINRRGASADVFAPSPPLVVGGGTIASKKTCPLVLPYPNDVTLFGRFRLYELLQALARNSGEAHHGMGRGFGYAGVGSGSNYAGSAHGGSSVASSAAGGFGGRSIFPWRRVFFHWLI